MPGPAPKPAHQRRRTNPVPGTVHLPIEGRRGILPPWPLGRPSRREVELWERLWKTPQAVAWERLGWADMVARYARVLVTAETRGAPIMVLAEARQLEDRLGLNPMSMLRLRWEIVEGLPAEEEEGVDVVLDIRERLKAVD